MILWLSGIVSYLFIALFVFASIRETGDKFTDYCQTVPAALLWPLSILAVLIFTDKIEP